MCKPQISPDKKQKKHVPTPGRTQFQFQYQCRRLYLSGWWFQPLWKIWKSMGRIIPYIVENKKCSKQPTSYGLHYACFLRVHSLQNRICLSNLSQPRFLLSCMASKHVQNTSRKMKTCNQYGSTNQSLLNSIYFWCIPKFCVLSWWILDSCQQKKLNFQLANGRILPFIATDLAQVLLVGI